MKAMFFVVAMALALVGCGGEGPAGGGGQEKRGMQEGTEQGNGMKTYRNSTLGVSFSYPPDWSLRESADLTRVTLSNAERARDGGLESQVDFALSPKLFGQSVRDQAGLKALLESRWPNRTWEPISFSFGQSGFFWKSVAADAFEGDYYLLDQNYNVLRVSYRAHLDLGGYGVVKSILQAMAIDFTAPVVTRVYFEPSVAQPGETVRIVVIAADDVSDAEVSVDLPENTGQTSRNDFYAPWSFFPRLQSTYLAYTEGYTTEFPLEGKFTRLTGNVLVHSFKVPEGAPAGEIKLPKIHVQDGKENSLLLSIDPAQSHYSLGVYPKATLVSPVQPQVAVEGLRIVRTARAPAPDTTAPKVKRAWFEKSFVGAKDSGQRLFIEVEDESPLRLIPQVELGSFFFSVQYLERESETVYSLPIDIRPKYSPQWREHNVAFTKLSLADEVGNITSLSIEDPDFPRAGFIFQY